MASDPPRFRYERFGGIVALSRPRSVAYLDREYARSIGFHDHPRWRGSAALGDGPLSAPTEVHLVLSRRCSAGCTGCYVGATPDGPALSEIDARAAIDRLAEMGVFHVALGGGEAVDLPYLLDVARHARRRGLVPNLTTSGLPVSDMFAREAAAVFGQINVSVDGLGAEYSRARGYDGFARAERALQLLRARTPHVGVNCVVSRDNADRLGPVVAWARSLRLSEVELLRFKPTGRGAGIFADRDLTPRQARLIYPRALWLGLRHHIRVKLDCSFAPMIFAWRPSRRVADFLGVLGCAGGDVLASIMPDGQWIGCSFGGPSEGHFRDPSVWERGFGAFRDFTTHAPEPCASCEYLALCRGGCRVVAAAAAGDWWQPDPGCPRVQRWKATHPKEPIGSSGPPPNHKLPVVA